MAKENLNASQRVIINNIIQELSDIKKRDDINGISNPIAIKRVCRTLEQEKVLTFNQAQDLEIYLFGILNLLKDSK